MHRSQSHVMIFAARLLILLLCFSIYYRCVRHICPRLKASSFEGIVCVFARLMGVRSVHVHDPSGLLKRKEPILFVSNHVSYVDILVLANVLQARFVAKNDIAKWPFIGLFAKSEGCVFVSRKMQVLKRELNHLYMALEKSFYTTQVDGASIFLRTSFMLKWWQYIKQKCCGRTFFAASVACAKRLVLFAEATTGHGCGVLPFYPAFFERPSAARSLLVPVSIKYFSVYGLPFSFYDRWRYAWTGRLTLLEHMQCLRRFYRHVGVSVHVSAPLQTFSNHHPGNTSIISESAIPPACNNVVLPPLHRKILAHNAQKIVEHLLSQNPHE